MAERSEELKREIDDTRDNLGVTLDAIGDRVSPGRIAERRVNRVKQSTGRLRERVMGVHETASNQASGITSSAGDMAGTVTGTVSDAASSVTGAVRSAPDTLSQTTQGNPLLVGALAFGVGAFVASLLPTTEAEQSVAGSVAEPIKGELSNIGGQIADATKGTAQDALETTKLAAMDAKDQVQQEASGAAQQVKDEAGSAKDRVSDTATS